jgi:hypothetical protein
MVAGKVVLVGATVLCLLSIGGAMLFAFPVLVPLHWVVSRDSGPYGTGGWAFLAALSMFEASWMLTYVFSEHEVSSVIVGAVVAAGTAAAFVRRGADRSVLRSGVQPAR